MSRRNKRELKAQPHAEASVAESQRPERRVEPEWRERLIVVGQQFSMALVQIGRRLLRGASRTARPRNLRLCESVSLGDKRLIALVKCHNEKFLVGASGSSLVMLARVETRQVTQDFSALLNEASAPTFRVQ